MPAGVQLAYDGKLWTLTVGRYRLVVPACRCRRPPCTCRRTIPRNWTVRGVHGVRYCHRGHAEHIAQLAAALSPPQPRPPRGTRHRDAVIARSRLGSRPYVMPADWRERRALRRMAARGEARLLLGFPDVWVIL